MSHPEERSLATVMRHPAVLGSVALLVLNDHLLKQAYPGWLTGKLSDVSGLVFFPVLLAMLLGWALR